MNPPELNYNAADSQRAWDEWGANCGPHSIAAACGISLESVKNALLSFPGWMSPRHLKETLLRLKWVRRDEFVGPKSHIDFVWKKQRDAARVIHPGNRMIARIQWEGEWLNSGEPPNLAYRETHWVAIRDGYVLDTVICAIQWVEKADWLERFDDFCKKEDYYGWHFTDFLHLQKAII